jgi:hypothetical protein
LEGGVVWDTGSGLEGLDEEGVLEVSGLHSEAVNDKSSSKGSNAGLTLLLCTISSLGFCLVQFLRHGRPSLQITNPMRNRHEKIDMIMEIQAT